MKKYFLFTIVSCILLSSVIAIAQLPVSVAGDTISTDRGSAVTEKPVLMGAEYVAAPTAVGDGDKTTALTDKFGYPASICDTSTVYDLDTNGKTQLVALSSGKVVYVCGVILTQSTTSDVTVSFGSGTGSDCGSTYTAKTPAWPIVAQTAATFQGAVLPRSGFSYFQTATSEELCISTSAGVSVQALVVYGQH